MVIMPYDGGRISRRINASGIHNVYTVDKLGTVKVSMTVKSYLTAVLLSNSDKRVKSLMHMMLVAVHAKYLDALCICDSYRFVVGKVTVSLYE